MENLREKRFYKDKIIKLVKKLRVLSLPADIER